jgi:hypothetical protein
MTSTNALTKFAPFSSTGVFQLALFCLALSSTAWAKPTFTLETTPNVCGGRLGVSGSGFPKGQVEFYANYQPTPKEQHPKRTEIGTATVGKDGLLSFAPQYSLDGGGPGCAYISSSTQLVTITVRYLERGKPYTEYERISLPDCSLVWGGDCPLVRRK